MQVGKYNHIDVSLSVGVGRKGGCEKVDEIFIQKLKTWTLRHMKMANPDAAKFNLKISTPEVTSLSNRQEIALEIQRSKDINLPCNELSA